MGAYAYCIHPGCGQGLGEPTAREVVEGIQYCPALHANNPSKTRDELLIELAERIADLESKVTE